MPRRRQYPITQFQENPFSIIASWYPKYLQCQTHFVEYSQYTGPVQTLAAFLNILLPLHEPNWAGLCAPSSADADPCSPSADAGPSSSSAGVGPSSSSAGIGPSSHAAANPSNPSVRCVSLVPYMRRLVATGFDTPAVLLNFFGQDWKDGVGQIHETERRNYLFAAKSDNWVSVKSSYDMGYGQIVPFLRPLRSATEREINNAESDWSDWLAMGDWMLGPRTPHFGNGFGHGNGLAFRSSPSPAPTDDGSHINGGSEEYGGSYANGRVDP